ncbi:MAG: aldolase [Oceanospirillaceae bacterium]|nr:aldolase [Oceanospirillaceae bacterium]
MRDHEKQWRIDLAAAFRWAARLGFHEAVANHFSLAVSEDGSRFLIQPRGRHFSKVRASELLLVDAEGTVLEGKGTLDPTAFHIHSAIHRRLPQARCILHTHMPYATALACIEGGRLEPVSQNALKFYGRVAYDEDFGGMALDISEGERLCAALGEKPILFMGNHGVTVAGSTVAEAFDELYFLEKACETQALAMSTGRPLKQVPDAVARTTCRQWQDYPDLAPLHFEELKRILDEEEPDYAM